MSKENFQIHENPSNKTKEIFKNLVSLILPKKLTFEEELKSLEQQRLNIKNILDKEEKNTPANNIIKEQPENLKKAA